MNGPLRPCSSRYAMIASSLFALSCCGRKLSLLLLLLLLLPHQRPSLLQESRTAAVERLMLRGNPHFRPCLHHLRTTNHRASWAALPREPSRYIRSLTTASALAAPPLRSFLHLQRCFPRRHRRHRVFPVVVQPLPVAHPRHRHFFPRFLPLLAQGRSSQRLRLHADLRSCPQLGALLLAYSPLLLSPPRCLSGKRRR
jgi:hypothetical protein